MITKKGTVVKISGEKTIKVEVNDYRAHPKYKKRYRITKRFLAHDEKGVAKVGDEVSIKQCMPISKRKSWVLTTDK
ncbi:MAG: 30S ribosomal protein S17 [Candidatus Peregrinibacteria bacterium]|nr:30S ribosomal protein S17 [Candidatus Peregrinibacteria bacterium]